MLGSIMQEYEEAGSSVPTLWKCTAEWTTKVQREMNEKHISTKSKLYFIRLFNLILKIRTLSKKSQVPSYTY